MEKKEIRPGIIVLEMTGSIRMGPDLQRIEQELKHLLAGAPKLIIFDLSRVSSIDSAGVGQIVKCFSMLKSVGGSLRLAGVKGMLEGVFQITQVNKVIGIYPTASAAAEEQPAEGKGQS
jgi:anti-anti-sigma factor